MYHVNSCPYCDSEDSRVDVFCSGRASDPYYWVECKNCDMKAPGSYNIVDAVRIWNILSKERLKTCRNCFWSRKGKCHHTEVEIDENDYCDEFDFK